MPLYRSERTGPEPGTLALLAGAGVAAGVTAWAIARSRENPVAYRPNDDAPDRSARSSFQDGPAPAGRTVTINRPRSELFAFWRDFSNLPRFMESIEHVTAVGDVSRWTIAMPLGRTATLETRIIEEVPDRLIAWRSTEASDIRAEGAVTFRDAPAGRGTEVEAVVAYIPTGGEVGRMVSRLFRLAPALQGRRELRRFKMLMEAGEIATSRNRKD
ncbi:SRPBCC family protein [Cereibacter azotoformans]|uniref:Putative secreted protein with PEP-CTERM sorting signal n=1 Tax=Cereibacter azotoformans TaxID=43057 RepID=A0A2T5K629_9RHOB|nr:SRPBCC family protein [Cereibacter azotoformans]AXQ95626.1 SRPBCC family protein [Cereibacter sphaeroides]PTR17819.1 putative secreted protein with PEP-CTERM sorting signal [Cereibacter azotoformans]UIJ32124.1 SRPBCC family protein [Cereibacter azotoformans]